MIDPENSVARLRRLGEMLSTGAGQSTPGILADVLGVPHNTTEFYRRVELLVDLAKLARKQVDELVDEAGYGVYVQAIDGIVNSLESLDMTHNWNDYLPAFNARALAQLEVCELSIARRLTVKPPEKEVLDELLHEIRENIQEVIDAQIEQEVRQLLLEMLRAVERALLAYEISGLSGLRVAVERTIGVAVLHYQRFEQSQEQGVVRRTFKTLGSIVSTLRNLDFIVQLPERLLDIFSLGQ